MTLFKPSTQIHVYDKILFWGPQGAGKTHAAMTWPEPIFVDREGGRAGHFADRFSFLHATPTSLAEVAAIFKELRSGVPGQTVVVDSGTAIYYDLVSEHTERRTNNDGKVSYVTDWVTVNRRFLDCLNFAFGIVGKHVLFTAHQSDRLVREGRDFKRGGLQFVGDERFRYAFDYIFRIESKGDPAKTPALFHVEKSASPHLGIGDTIPGLTFATFIEITRPDVRGEAKADAIARGDQLVSPTRLSDDDAVGPDEIRAIEHAIAKVGIDHRDVVDICIRIAGAIDYRSTTVGKARTIFAEIVHFKRAGVA